MALAIVQNQFGVADNHRLLQPTAESNNEPNDSELVTSSRPGDFANYSAHMYSFLYFFVVSLHSLTSTRRNTVTEYQSLSHSSTVHMFEILSFELLVILF